MKMYATVDKNGRLPEKISKHIGSELKLLSGYNVKIIIDTVKNERSNNQNAYYWGVVICDIKNAINAEGNNLTPDQTHELLRQELGLCDSICVNGVYKDVYRSTTKYNTKEFGEYMEKCRAWAADVLNIEINLPKEY